jgi:hypothetical protein
MLNEHVIFFGNDVDQIGHFVWFKVKKPLITRLNMGGIPVERARSYRPEMFEPYVA